MSWNDGSFPPSMNNMPGMPGSGVDHSGPLAFRPGPPPHHRGRHHHAHGRHHHGPPPPPPGSAPTPAPGTELALITDDAATETATDVNSKDAQDNDNNEKGTDNDNTNNDNNDNTQEGGRRWGGRRHHHHWGGRHADWEAYAGMPWGGPWAAGVPPPPPGFAGPHGPHGFGGGHHGHRHHHGHHEGGPGGFGEFGFGGQGHFRGHGHHGHGRGFGRRGRGAEDGANVTDEEQQNGPHGRGFGRHGGHHHGDGHFGRRGGFGRWRWDESDAATAMGTEAAEPMMTVDAKFGDEEVTTSSSSSSSESESEEDIAMIEKDASPSTVRGETPATGAAAGAAAGAAGAAATADGEQPTPGNCFRRRGGGSRCGGGGFRGWRGPRGPPCCESCEEARSARRAARAARHAARAAAYAARSGEEGGANSTDPAESGAPGEGEGDRPRGFRRGHHGGRHGAHAHGFHGHHGGFHHGHGPWTRGDFFDAGFGPGGPYFHHQRFGPAGPHGGPHAHGHRGRHGGRHGGPFGFGGPGGPFGPTGPFGPSGPFGPGGPIGRAFGPDGVGRRSFGPMMAALANHPVARNLRDMSRAYFGDAGAARDAAPGADAAATSGDNDDYFVPPVDIFVDDNRGGWILHVALPGANKEDIDVQWDADRGLLTIAGVVVRPGNEAFLEGLINAERRVGLFQREVRLPPFGDQHQQQPERPASDSSAASAAKQEVDAAGITARVENGVLIVVVPTVDKEWTEVQKVDIE